jgi:transposase-like protein
MEAANDRQTQWAAIRLIVPGLGVSAEALRRWVRQAEVEPGERPGVTELDNGEIRRLRKEVTARTRGVLRGRPGSRGAPEKKPGPSRRHRHSQSGQYAT